MKSELLPASKDRSVKITMALSRDPLALLDRFCAKTELTRSELVRRALKAAAFLQRAIYS